eukprot:gene6497-10505_t
MSKRDREDYYDPRKKQRSEGGRDDRRGGYEGSRGGRNQRGGFQRGGYQNSRGGYGSSQYQQSNQNFPQLQIVKIDPNNVQGGQQIDLITNYFQIKEKTIGSVEFSKICLVRQFLGGKFDSKDLIYIYDREKEESLVILNEKSNQKMILKKTKKIEIKKLDKEILMIFNILLKNEFNKIHGLRNFGRGLFDFEQKPKSVGGIQILKGFEGGHIHTNYGLFYRSDVIFRSMQGITFKEMLERSPSLISSTAFKVYLVHTKKVQQIDFIDKTRGPSDKFSDRQGGEKTFAQYYKERYNIELMKDQPMLVKKRDGREEVYPAQLVIMLGLPDHLKNNNQFKRDYKSATMMSIQERASTIQKMFEDSSKNENFSSYLGNWNMEMDPKMVSLTAKVLENNTVEFGSGKTEKGISWDWREKKLKIAPNMIQNWFIICPKGKGRDIEFKFLPQFHKFSGNIGLEFNSRVQVIETSDYADCLKKCQRKDDEFILIFLDRETQYQEVQKIVKQNSPVITQCCLMKTSQRDKGLASIITNLAIQISTKMGGTPWDVRGICRIPTMFVGISTAVKDTLAFTSTFGENGGKLYSKVGKEKQLLEFFSCGLAQFFKKVNVFPFQIVLYREGLTEGVESQVSIHEIKLISDFLKEALDEENKHRTIAMRPVEIAYLSCSKNNVTRFFSQKQSLVNPPSGTVLDHTIIDDGFFLFAADVRQGSGSPVRFKICFDGLQNPNGISDLQSVRYKLCYGYYNWNGTIPVPSVLKYAEKIARQFINNNLVETDDLKPLQDKIFYI